jgi:predicted nucleic acid-binding protein
MLVVDASVIVAAVGVAGADGAWARDLLAAHPLCAPHLVAVEAASVLRRAVASGELSADAASLAHADVTDLAVELFPYAPFAPRVWELRQNLTPYDAWYVALAEALDAPLATLDRRLARAPGPRCRFETPPPRR